MSSFGYLYNQFIIDLDLNKIFVPPQRSGIDFDDFFGEEANLLAHNSATIHGKQIDSSHREVMERIYQTLTKYPNIISVIITDCHIQHNHFTNWHLNSIQSLSLLNVKADTEDVFASILQAISSGKLTHFIWKYIEESPDFNPIFQMSQILKSYALLQHLDIDYYALFNADIWNKKCDPFTLFKNLRYHKLILNQKSLYCITDISTLVCPIIENNPHLVYLRVDERESSNFRYDDVHKYRARISDNILAKIAHSMSQHQNLHSCRLKSQLVKVD